MTLPLMPKATAVWLVENSRLTFSQIADFCGLHVLEIQAIADDEVAIGIHGLNPVQNGQLTREELERCEKDPARPLALNRSSLPLPVSHRSGARYTPVSKRQDKPDAIAWMVKHYPALSDGQISRLLGTTKRTIQAVRDRSHWNMPNIKARHPASLGLCTQLELDTLIEKTHAPALEPAGGAAQAVAEAD